VREKLRLKALEEERASSTQSINESYRDKTIKESGDFKDKLYNKVLNRNGISKSLKDRLYSSISSDYYRSSDEMAKSGRAIISGDTYDLVAEVVEATTGRKMQTLKADKNGKVDTNSAEYKNNQEVKKAINIYLKMIRDAAKGFRSVITEKQQDYNAYNEQIDAQMGAVTQTIVRRTEENIEAINNAHGLINKAATDFTPDDEAALKAVVANRNKELEYLDPSKDAQRIQEIHTEVDANNDKLREVAKAYIMNPLMGTKFELNGNKYEKAVDKNGNVIYEKFKNFNAEMAEQLVETVKNLKSRWTDFRADSKGRVDKDFFQMSEFVGNYEKSINDLLKKHNLQINSKDELEIHKPTKSGSSSSNEQDKKARESYQALLNNIRTYFDERNALIQESYKQGAMTAEQYNQHVEKNELDFYNARAEMFKMLLDEQSTFDKESIIRDKTNWNKVHAWVQSNKNHMQDTVRKDAAETQKRNNETIIKNLQEVEQILVDRNPFRKILRQYQSDMEKLMAFPMKTSDLGSWTQQKGEGDEVRQVFSFETNPAQERADKLMQVFVNAIDKVNKQGDITFQEAVEKTEGVFDLMESVEQEGGVRVLNVSAKQWELLYMEALKASQAIDEKRKSELTKNSEMLNSMAANDERYMELQRKQTQLANRKEQDSSDAAQGGMSQRALYLQNIDFLNKNYNLEYEMYRRRLELLTQWLDKKYEMTEDEHEREEILNQKTALATQMRNEQEEKNLTYTKSITDAMTAEFNRRLEKYRDTLEAMGELAGTLATAELNSINDRMAAVNKMATAVSNLILKEIEAELKKYAFQKMMAKKEDKLKDTQKNTASDSVKEQLQTEKKSILSLFKFKKKQAKKEVKQEEAKQDAIVSANTSAGKELVDTQQATSDAQQAVTEGFTQAQSDTAQALADKSAAIAENSAAQQVGTDLKKGTAELAIDSAEGQGKEIASKGIAGLATAALVTAAIAGLSTVMNAIVSKLFPSAKSSSSSTKKLATGMLTYAEGRYTVDGNDGHTYSAQYEPVLQTGIYDGGKGKAHMALFSEVMPEMVISGPTTRNIQQNYPELMDAIMTIERHGSLRRALPAFADGNVSSFAVPSSGGASGTNDEDAAAQQAQFFAAMSRMSDVNEALLNRLSQPITAELNMYGKNGAKEKMDRANKFYTKNKL
jgi:hypothetical protein